MVAVVTMEEQPTCDICHVICDAMLRITIASVTAFCRDVPLSRDGTTSPFILPVPSMTTHLARMLRVSCVTSAMLRLYYKLPF